MDTMATLKTGINERTRQPNKFINFIKPLEGPDKAIAQDYLERIPNGYTCHFPRPNWVLPHREVKKAS